MGADIIGWRECALQQQLGLEGFLGKLKLAAYKLAVEEQVPQEEWDSIRVEVYGTNEEMLELGYADIVSQLASFRDGIPECADCPLSGGLPVGCYRYVRYPVDAEFERLLFEFFAGQVAEADSICDTLYRDVIAHLDEGHGWYEQRDQGPQSIALLPQPLQHCWTDAEGAEHTVDSAQVLLISFVSLEMASLVAAYTRYWTEFLDFVDARDTTSRTVDEVRALAALLHGGLAGALESGWTIVIDG